MKKGKDIRYNSFDILKIRKVEYIVTLVIGIVFLVMFVISIYNKMFIPCSLIAFAMLLFCICCYYVDDYKKKCLVYILFFIGLVSIVIGVIYTLRNIL